MAELVLITRININNFVNEKISVIHGKDSRTCTGILLSFTDDVLILEIENRFRHVIMRSLVKKILGENHD